MTTASQQEIEQRLTAFIVEELLEEEDPFDGEDPLAEGAVDSLAVEQLIEYVQEAFAIELADEEIDYRNFASVPALAAFVRSK